jgi:mono/diheme cytochrome c family protein
VTPPQRQIQGASLGLALFQSACASCHAFDGTGVDDPRPALVDSPTVNDTIGVNLV